MIEHQTSTTTCTVLLIAVLTCAPTLPAQPVNSQGLDFFESKIRPVLVRECYSCHSEQAGQAKGGLQVDNQIRLAVGGNSGPAIVPGSLDESLLWNAINYEDFAMPPHGQLSPEIIADFQRWIQMGAPDPRREDVEPIQSTVTPEDIRQGKEFWAYQSLQPAPLPHVSDPEWTRSPIDHFIYAKLEANKLQPSDDAQPHTLLRRLSFDLLGLPPEPENLAEFVQAWNLNPDSAVAQAVDRMLADPGFGERWGRHWLDVARYAESTGREVNATYPQAWRYRDYVIDAFNQDKPYNEFIHEQIAGDLLPAIDDKEWATHLIATGFLAIGPKSLAEQNARQFELDLIDEQIDVATRVILGTSVACARCHDHKFDPITQSDYYAMAGIFQSTTTHYGTLDTTQNRRPSNHLILPIDDPNPFDSPLSRTEIDELENERVELERGLRELLQERRLARRDKASTTDLRRTFAQLTGMRSRMAAVDARLDSVDRQGKPRSFCMGVQDHDRPQDARLLVRGEFDQPADVVSRGVVKVLSDEPVHISRRTSGRLELAHWMTDRNHPLTARVMVNRIWLHLFGEGIVRTPENFGATGLRPTHPELLDWLAIEFTRHNWSIKHLIRRIVMSRTYRMNSRFDQNSFEIDPENRYLWRANPRQLDAEALRDAMLAVGGTIDRQRPRASLVAQAGMTIVRDGKLIAFDSGASGGVAIGAASRQRAGGQYRGRMKLVDLNQIESFRSVYLPIVRDHLPRGLEVFDFAEPGMVVGQRDTSNTPAQGLYLMNNEFVSQQSRHFAERLLRKEGDRRDRIQLAFQLAFARNATPDEVQMAEAFLDDFPARHSFRDDTTVSENRLQAFAQAIMASAEFRYLN